MSDKIKVNDPLAFPLWLGVFGVLLILPFSFFNQLFPDSVITWLLGMSIGMCLMCAPVIFVFRLYKGLLFPDS